MLASLVLVLSSLQTQLEILAKESPNTEIKNSIMQCESGGNPKAFGAGDIKLTGYASHGLFQFQPQTFLKFGIKYNVFPEGTTLKEAMKFIKNPVYNGAVAHGMMDDGLYSHWLNCYNKFLAQK